MSNKDQLVQMRDLLVEVNNAADQLDFNLKVALGPVVNAELSDDFIQDLAFDVHRLTMFSKAVLDAWKHYE